MLLSTTSRTQAQSLKPRRHWSDVSTSGLYDRTSIIAFAVVQYPVHSYMLYALRDANDPYLSGDLEDEWGFGQVVALIMVASVLLQCIQAIIGRLDGDTLGAMVQANLFAEYSIVHFSN